MGGSEPDYLIYVIPGLVAVLGNIIFYVSIKKKIDSSIEKFRVTYSGVFQEKVAIYKELLEKIYEIKSFLYSYHLSGELPKQIKWFLDPINDLYKFSQINSPFLSKEMNRNLHDLFQDFRNRGLDIRKYYHAKNNSENINDKKYSELCEKFWNADEDLLDQDSDYLGKLERHVILQMRKDLGTND